MLKQNGKGNILPPLQRRIILCLAKIGSQTINEITKNIPLLKLAPTCHYKPTWLSIKWLKNKKLIQEAGTKEYRGRKYPQFWLTDDGAIAALIEGAPLMELIDRAKDVYPDNQRLICYLDVASRMNPDVFKVGFSAIRMKGKIEAVDFVTMLLTEMQTKKSDEKIKEIVNTLRAYPEEYSIFQKNVEKIFENLVKLKERT